jgi:pantoate--beta-alanine ligase
MRPQVVSSVEALRSLGPPTAPSAVVGFVPTMGALHAGHASLMRVARTECDVVIASIFVNPLQFDRKDDLDRYPRTLEADLDVCAAEGVDIVFAPETEQMYPRAPACTVRVSRLSDHLCGAHRPGHFDGVATVVLKLFEMVKAHRAYFGEKDRQQLVIIRRLVDDLNLPTTVVGVPTVREQDGLALSSRNRHLSTSERAVAPALIGMLRNIDEQVHAGARTAADILERARATAPASRDVRVEYLQLVDLEDLQPVQAVEGPTLAAGALWVGRTRLIDNMVVTP